MPVDATHGILTYELYPWQNYIEEYNIRVLQYMQYPVKRILTLLLFFLVDVYIASFRLDIVLCH